MWSEKGSRNGEEGQRSHPTLFEKREDCCGCFACFAKCPHNAIVMLEDKEGFLYPFIDKEKCVRCYQCEFVCPIKYKDRKETFIG